MCCSGRNSLEVELVPVEILHDLLPHLNGLVLVVLVREDDDLGVAVGAHTKEGVGERTVSLFGKPADGRAAADASRTRRRV